MAIEDIKKTLEQRFSEPLNEFYTRRIIFWNDEEKGFTDEICELELRNAKVLILTETNNFEVKKLLSHDDLHSNYLVYNSFDVSMEDDWLLDIKLFSEEFRADQISMWMQEMNIVPNPAVRNTVKFYRGFFNAASRRKLVAQFGDVIDNPNMLHLAVLASICKVQKLDCKAIIRAVMAAGNDVINELKLSILSYNASDIFWKLVLKVTGYESEKVPNIDDMNIHIVLSAMTKTMHEKHLEGLENRYNSFFNGFCYELIYEWLYSDKKDQLIDVLRFVEKKLRFVDRFNEKEISDLVDTEILPCIDEIILNKLMERILHHTIHADEIIAIIEKRRTMIWYKDNEYYYSALMQVAYMQKFHDQYIRGFHHANAKELWNAYTNAYYIMDSYYRKFHVAFVKSLTSSNHVLDDGLRNVVEEVEGLYKHWYLDNLAENFTNVIERDLADNGYIVGINSQADFYNQIISSYDNKVFVIISDALRYEVAVDIAEQLCVETKADVTIDSQQAVFPSITKIGMAALLPHKELSIVRRNDNFNVLADGSPTEMADRAAILKKHNPQSLLVRYKDFILMKKDEQRELIKGQEVIYIYHDTIDSLGHYDEMNVFSACEAAQAELVNLVRVITGSLNGVNIVITSDHGFLYTHKPLHTEDKMERSPFKQDILEQGRRICFYRYESKSRFFDAGERLL